MFVLIEMTQGHVTLLDHFRPNSSYRDQKTIVFSLLFLLIISVCYKKLNATIPSIIILQEEVPFGQNWAKYEHFFFRFFQKL